MKQPAFLRPLASIATAAVIVVMFVSNASAQRNRINPGIPTQRMLARYGLERAWASQATMNVGRARVRYLTVDEDNLYVQSSEGIVTAFDNETGRRRWAAQLGRLHDASFNVVSNDDLALIITGMTMWCMDKFTGEQLWQLRLPTSPSTGPTMDDWQVYYGTVDGSIYAFDLRKIRELHNEGKLPQYTNVAQSWRYKAADEITTPSLSDGALLNFASRDKSLYSITTGTRKLQWQFETNAPISAPLGWSQGTIYLASEDFNVFCIDQFSGAVRWYFIAGLPIKKQPRIIGNDVYIFAHHGGMHCLNKVNGRRKWWKPNLVDFVGATRQLLFCSDQVKNIIVLDRRDGAIVGALPLRHFPIHFRNELTDRLYLATEAGTVVCIREKGMEFPTYHLYPDRQPIIPEFAPEEPPSADPNAAEPNAAGDPNGAGAAGNGGAGF